MWTIGVCTSGPPHPAPGGRSCPAPHQARLPRAGAGCLLQTPLRTRSGQHAATARGVRATRGAREHPLPGAVRGRRPRPRDLVGRRAPGRGRRPRAEAAHRTSPPRRRCARRRGQAAWTSSYGSSAALETSTLTSVTAMVVARGNASRLRPAARAALRRTAFGWWFASR